MVCGFNDGKFRIYNYVYAGVYDETFIVTEFSPPLNIDIVWDKDNIYGFRINDATSLPESIYGIKFKLWFGRKIKFL